MFIASVVRRSARHAVAALAVLASLGAAAAPNGWTITDLGAGYFASHINNRGDILPNRMTVDGIRLQITGLNNLGVASANGENGGAYLIEGGLLTSVVGLTYAYGINDAGQVAGQRATNGYANAALWQGGSSTPLVGEGIFPDTAAFAVNSNGDAVGYATFYLGVSGSQGILAVLYSGGQVSPIALEGPSSYARAINDDRVVVGSADTKWGFSSHAFMFRDGVTTDLGTLGGRSSTAFDINKSNQIVGSSNVSWISSLGAAFLYEHERMTNLSLLPEVQAAGWDLLDSATNINDLGQIVGYGTRGGVTHGFLLSPADAPPVPEPATWALAALGLAALVVRQRSSRRRLQPTLEMQPHQPARRLTIPRFDRRHQRPMFGQ